jgi:hypothetical protein
MCNITLPRNRVDTVEVERFEINPDHEIFVMLDKVRETDPELAQRAVAQVFDNALIAAGLLEDPRGMLDRLNTLITDALKACGGRSWHGGCICPLLLVWAALPTCVVPRRRRRRDEFVSRQPLSALLHAIARHHT